MAKTTRQIITIDEELCNGCGACVPSCAEGAIRIVDGKAKLVSERYCDGLGACLGECPRGALSFETREAEEFDEEAAVAHVKSIDREAGHSHAGHVCPSACVIDRTREIATNSARDAEGVPSELRTWPVKLYLVNPSAPYFENADLLIASDCVPFAFGAFHSEMLRGKTVVCGCPKFDDADIYVRKLTEILRLNNIRSITIVQMEVPCCAGISQLARLAVRESEKDVPVETVTISLEGDVVGRKTAAI